MIKPIDYDIIFDRMVKILAENGEDDFEGVSQTLADELTYNARINADTIFDFCEHYGCSVDYLLGRSDVYSVV